MMFLIASRVERRDLGLGDASPTTPGGPFRERVARFARGLLERALGPTSAQFRYHRQKLGKSDG